MGKSKKTAIYQDNFEDNCDFENKIFILRIKNSFYLHKLK